MKVRSLVDKQEILGILESDRLYAAYAIGDLGALFERCEWALAEDGTGPRALAMSYNALHTPVLFTMGDSAGVEAIVAQKLRPERAVLAVREEHAAAMRRLYHTSDMRHMWRMSVNGATFRAVAGPVRRLHRTDISELNWLCRWGGSNYFDASQLDDGVYYAAEVEGGFVAVAGTHVIAPQYGIAAVGNVYTHPDHRNRGFATSCTSAVTAELLALGCRDVVLNVWQDNPPAVRAYRKLGFAVHCPFLEGSGQRRSCTEQIWHRLVRRR